MKETENYPSSTSSRYDSLLFVFTYHPNKWSLTLRCSQQQEHHTHMTWIWIFFFSDAVRLFFYSFILLNPSVPVCYYFRGSVFTLIFSVSVSVVVEGGECAVTHCRMQMYEDFFTILFFLMHCFVLLCGSLSPAVRYLPPKRGWVRVVSHTQKAGENRTTQESSSWSSSSC